MPCLWKRLNEKNWRIVFKALELMQHLIRMGSERVIEECKTADDVVTSPCLKSFGE